MRTTFPSATVSLKRGFILCEEFCSLRLVLKLFVLSLFSVGLHYLLVVIDCFGQVFGWSLFSLLTDEEWETK